MSFCRNANPLQWICVKFDETCGKRLFCCLTADEVYITAQVGIQHCTSNTDEMKPFNRKKITGTRISTDKEYINSQKDESNPQAADTTMPGGGTSIGGSTNGHGDRKQSKLLQRRAPDIKIDNSMDEDELLDGSESPRK